MSTSARGYGAPLLVAAILIVLLGGQAAAFSSTPSADRASTARVLGTAGFAYLGGLRTFTAAVLWNQLDPVMHEYYSGRSLKDQQFLLPSLKMVTVLDPQFTEAYYVSSFVVTQRGDVSGGIRIARDGLANNRDSGLMYSNLTQLLLLRKNDADKTEMLRLARTGISDSVQWRNVDEHYDGLIVFRAVFHLAGDSAQVESLNEQLRKLAASDEYGASADHDHNGDGKQDH